jgi:hypothetical protein
VEIDFTLRKAKYDPFKLLPAFLQELDQREGNNAYRIVCSAWQEQWFELYDLINGMVFPAHDSWYANPKTTLPFVANLLGVPDLSVFDDSVKNFAVWCWPWVRGEKGVIRSVVTLSALLGYRINVLPLWSAFAIPNPENLADSSNDPYLAYWPAIPLATNGILNEEAAAIRAGNGTWILAKPLQGGETEISLLNSPAFTQPEIGFTVFFPHRLEPYKVVDSTLNSMVIDQPLSVVHGTVVKPGTELPVFNPLILYPSPFYDLELVADPGVTDPSPMVTAFNKHLAVLQEAVIPIRDRLHRVLSTYWASASYTASCPYGTVGASVTRHAAATSKLSYPDALAKAQNQAMYAAIADLRCNPIEPIVDIVGVEPVAATVFYATITYTASCPANYYGDTCTVTATRTSKIDQAHADALAYAAAYGLAEAGISCTRDIPPLIIIGPAIPVYKATVTVTKACPYGMSGDPVTVTLTERSAFSYADAEAQALSKANAQAEDALECIPSTVPTVSVSAVRYTITVGVTVTKECPSGQFGNAVSVARSVTYRSTATFQPDFAQAIALVTAGADIAAAAQIECFSDSGPTISVSEPLTSYSATVTVTEACPTGLNYMAGNVVTAIYTESGNQDSYLSAEAAAGSGASGAAIAALVCAAPEFNPDAFLLVAKDEFGLDLIVRYDGSDLPFNSGHDFYANGVSLGNARSDFSRFLEEDAPKLLAKGLTKVVLQVDWFTLLSVKTAVLPKITADFVSRTGGNGDSWNVGNLDRSNTGLLPGSGMYRCGTMDDDAFVDAVMALSQAGFQVGLNPVVTFIDTVNSVIVDRADVNYDSSADIPRLPIWCAFYTSFINHYLDLFADAGVDPFVVYLGNGYRGLTHSANIAQRRIFLRTLLSLSHTIYDRFPEAILTYAARHDEYGYDAELKDFPLDGLWNSELITLGLNWFEPNGSSAALTTRESFFLLSEQPGNPSTMINSAPIELGMRFKVEVSGFIVGVTFYKGVYNTGTHVGNLWEVETGSRLSSVTFTKETPSGWQQALFPVPIPVQPGITYVISYFAPIGGYAADAHFFINTQTNGNITVAGGTSGVYAYGSSSVLPTIVQNVTNYYVDVIFLAMPGPTELPVTWNSAQVGANSGEDMYYMYNDLPDLNRDLSTTDHSGKANVPSIAIYPGIGWKNIGAYLSTEYYHYIPIPEGFAAGVTPLPGNSYGDDCCLSSLTLVPKTGTAFLESRFHWFAPREPGIAARPESEWITALTVGGKGHAKATLPDVLVGDGTVASPIVDFIVEVDFKPDFGGSPPTTGFPAIVSVPDDLFQIEYDGGYRRVRSAIPVKGAFPDFVTPGVFADDGAITQYYLRFFTADGTNWQVTEGAYFEGVLSATTYKMQHPPYLYSTLGVLYFGTRNGSADFWSGSVFRFKLSASDRLSTLYPPIGLYYGGSFHFDEPYAGTRTGFDAANVPVMVTELGAPSIEGGLLEPRTELTPLAGGPMSLPDWLDSDTSAYWTSVQANGYTFSDLRGPYGTNFRGSELQQQLGVTATFDALKAAGIKKHFVVAEYDVRSPAAFGAMYGGQYVYSDGPLYPFRRVLNGKLLLGI